MDYSLTALLADVRRVGSIPAAAGTGSQDADLIAHLNSALLTVSAEVIKCREGFLRRYKDYSISATTNRYRIPTRAVGNRLAALLLLDSGGRVLRKLDEIAYSNLSQFNNVTDVMGYMLEAGDIVMTPVNPSGAVATIRMVFYCRPGQLDSSLDAAAGDCFTVTAVSGNILTLMASHGLTTLTKVDVLKGGAPFEYLSVDELPGAAASTTVTVADGRRVEVGDFVCKADKSPVAQVPDCFQPVLVALAAQKFWRALNDSEAVKSLELELYGADGKNGLVGEARALISPRNEEGAKKIMSPFGALGSLNGPARRVY